MAIKAFTGDRAGDEDDEGNRETLTGYVAAIAEWAVLLMIAAAHTPSRVAIRCPL